MVIIYIGFTVVFILLFDGCVSFCSNLPRNSWTKPEPPYDDTGFWLLFVSSLKVRTAILIKSFTYYIAHIRRDTGCWFPLSVYFQTYFAAKSIWLQNLTKWEVTQSRKYFFRLLLRSSVSHGTKRHSQFACMEKDFKKSLGISDISSA